VILIAPVVLSLKVLVEVLRPHLGGDAWTQTSVMALVLPLLGLLLCAGFGVGPWMARTERWLHRQLRWSVTATWLVATGSALVTSILAATGHCS
jgi:hypothetical protein